MIQKLLADDRGVRESEPLPAFLNGLGSIFTMVFSSFFYHFHYSINIAIIIIISYFLKIVELWGNSQKRNKANKDGEWEDLARKANPVIWVGPVLLDLG